jgi:hypothetical protein
MERVKGIEFDASDSLFEHGAIVIRHRDQTGELADSDGALTCLLLWRHSR